MGLIDGAMRGAQPDEPETAPVEEQDAATGGDVGEDFKGEQPTPEEQQAYDRFVSAGLAVIFGIPPTAKPGEASPEQQAQADKMHKGVLGVLQSERDRPEKALSDATTMIVTQLDQASGRKTPETVIPNAALELMGNLAELAEKKGIFQVDDATKAKAVQMLVMTLGSEYGVDPADLKALIDKVGPDKAKQIAQSQMGGQSQPMGGQQEPMMEAA